MPINAPDRIGEKLALNADCFINDVGNVQAMAFDSYADLLFYSDARFGTIHRKRMGDGGRTDVIAKQAGNVKGEGRDGHGARQRTRARAHVHAHTCTRTRARARTLALANTRVHAWQHSHACQASTHMYTRTRTRKHTRTYTHIYTHVRLLYTYCNVFNDS